MDVQFINPFIQSVMNTMEMMVGEKPGRAQPYVKDNKVTQGDVTGIIGFAEKNVTGSVALSFPENTAFHVYNMLTGEDPESISREVQDSIGELTNIVAGGAKAELAKQGLSFHISIPSVIVGRNHAISHKVDTPVVVLPFTLGQFQFVMEVSMKIF